MKVDLPFSRKWGVKLIDLAFFIIMYFLLAWLIEGNAWLHWLLAYIFVTIIDIESKIKDTPNSLDVIHSQLMDLNQKVYEIQMEYDKEFEIAELKNRVELLEQQLENQTGKDDWEH